MADDDVVNIDEDVDETVGERIRGLSEMFPASVRNAVSGAVSGTCSAAVVTLKFARSAVWVISSSMVIMLLPYVFEKERHDFEENQRQEERNVLFGGPPQPR